MALPRFVVFKSNYNDKYLRYIYEDVEVHRLLQFSGEDIMSPYVKYEVELAKCGKGLVHIRCCYNNKYWVRWSPDNWWIAAAADEPEEDKSKWSCTLFEPIFVNGHGDGKTVVRLRHIQLNHNACLWRTAPPHESCLFANVSTPDEPCDLSTIIDWESLVKLPKHIAFKGQNGNYINARVIEGSRLMQFVSSDIGDETVGNEVFTTRDGSVRIKSDRFGKFWRCNLDWICADSDDTTANKPDMLFWPIKVDNNVIALRNLGNNNFCKSLSTAGKTNCLNAAVSTISKEVRLQVEELVVSRKIYNVNFRLKDARIYNRSLLTMTTKDVVNRTPEPTTVELKFSYAETRSSTWNDSVSLKLGVKASMETDIPVIKDGKIEISIRVNTTCQWGETKTSTIVVDTVHKVTVPPMTMVRVHLLATEASCEVPFSYSKRDTLTNGKQIINNMDDGVYTGINCFDFKYETEQENL